MAFIAQEEDLNFDRVLLYFAKAQANTLVIFVSIIAWPVLHNWYICFRSFFHSFVCLFVHARM